jgi:hypothetical protein
LRNHVVAANSSGTVTSATSVRRQSIQNMKAMMAKIITTSPSPSMTPEVKSSLSESTSEVSRVMTRPTGFLSK